MICEIVEDFNTRESSLMRVNSQLLAGLLVPVWFEECIFCMMNKRKANTKDRMQKEQAHTSVGQIVSLEKI